MIQPANTENLSYFAELSARSGDSTLTLAQLSNYLQQGGLFSINHNGSAVGLIAFRRVVTEADLDQILVDPVARRQGLAKNALMDWHEWLRRQSVECVFLDVRRGNLAASSLYRQLGYEQVGERKNYYHQGSQCEDALLMKKLL